MNIKVFNLISRINETKHVSWHKTCTCKCRLNASFETIKNLGITINADVNAKNSLSNVDVMMDLFGTLVYVNVNVINHVILENNHVMKIVNVEKH